MLTQSIKMKSSLQYILIFVALLSSTSCDKDFEELNRNPFNPTQTDIGPLFNTVISSLRLGWNEQFYLHNETLYGITQQAALTAATFQNISIGTEEVWSNYYQALAHIRELERRFDDYQGDPEALNNVRAMVKILLAYKTFHLSDLFGDIPFFEAGRGFESLDYARPPFDPQKDIYQFLLEELKWANDNISTHPQPTTAAGEAYLSFGDFDNFFNGNMLHWKKFANALRLRHALRIIEKDPNFATPIITEIIENDLPLIETGEEVALWPSQLDWPKQSVHWSFREHKKLRMGSNIWHQLSENDESDGSGIFDPRAFIFFETNNAGEWVPFPQIPDTNTPPSGGIPYQGQRDNNYTLKGASNIYSPFNYYLIRDESYIPEIILTAAEVHYMKAEIYFRGLGVATDVGGAESEYTLGVVASIQFWQDIVSNTPIWENKPAILTQGEIFQVVNHPRLSIFLSDNKLELIYAQRWLDAFRQPWEAYSLARRTLMTPREGEAIKHFRFPYPASEAENNSVHWGEQLGRMGEDSDKVKVWWMR